MKNARLTGAAMAIAAASMFATVPTSVLASGDANNVHCYGVNKCKGHNDCKTDKNACKGHASCKGQGFVSMSKHACEEIGGKAGE